MAPARLLTFSAERPVEPGRYRRDGFEPPFTIDLPVGWFAVQDVPGFFDLEIRLVDTEAGLLAVLLGGSVRTWDEASAAAEPILSSIRFQ